MNIKRLKRKANTARRKTESHETQREVNLSNYYSELISRLSRPIHLVISKPERVRLIVSHLLAILAMPIVFTVKRLGDMKTAVTLVHIGLFILRAEEFIDRRSISVRSHYTQKILSDASTPEVDLLLSRRNQML